MSKVAFALNALLAQNPDGIVANFLLKGGAAAYAGAIRKCKLPDAPEGLYEALCTMNVPDESGRPTKAMVMTYFDSEELAVLLVPQAPPSIVAPGPGIIPGLRGREN